MDYLKNKSVLFFSPRFFNYENEIKNALESQGAKVVWFDDRPSNNTFLKAIIRLNKNVIKRKIERYYKNILAGLKAQNEKFDYVFFLNPETISKENLTILRSEYPDANFILYMWDSFENRKHTADLLPIFDHKYTFDSRDALKYDIKLRALFYTDLYKEKKEVDIIYDFLFVGTAHSDRYLLVNKLLSQVSNNVVAKRYFFLNSRWLFFARKLTERNFKTVSYKDIEFKPIKHTSNASFVHQSKIILDVCHPKQVGLTMRTIETLGAQRKLITTNKDIINYDFYDQHNILIIDKETPTIPQEFLQTPFVSATDYILQKYSIYGWIKEVFDLH